MLGGHSVLAAGSGAEALGILEARRTPIDLALLDVTMPAMDGVELADRIRSACPRVKIVLMTGFAPGEVKGVTPGSIPCRVIGKPFKTDSLLQMIDDVLQDTARANGA